MSNPQFTNEDLFAIAWFGLQSIDDSGSGYNPEVIETEIVDEELIIYEYLNLPNTNLKDAVGSNIFVDFVNDGFEGDKQAGIMIRLRPSGETSYFNAGKITNTVCDIYCYGGSRTPHDSKVIYQKLFARIGGQNNIQTPNGFIIKSEEYTRPQLLKEPDTNWFVCLSTWNFYLRKNN